MQICYDVTHLVARLGIPTPSGIDQVDLAYAKHFISSSNGPFIHYGLWYPHVLNSRHAKNILNAALKPSWISEEATTDPAFEAVRSALIGGGRLPKTKQGVGVPHSSRRPWSAELEIMRHRATLTFKPVPKNAIYLNVAQLALENERYFRWLRRRPDVKAVFFIHDLLPLDYPEFFRPNYKERFTRRMDTALGYGHAFIVTTEVVKHRLLHELEERGLPARPVLVAPLPSSLPHLSREEVRDAERSKVPYFISVGTIEPRKNNLLLLNIWRQLAEEGSANGTPVPKLVLVGGRGWENEQVLDILDRSPFAQEHVIEASGLSPKGLARLLINARALLLPSFAEGYGIPAVEALTLGKPVLATDAPVFREVTQGKAIYMSAVDGMGWKSTIKLLQSLDVHTSAISSAAALSFIAPSWNSHFMAVDKFMESLTCSLRTGLAGC